jgi:TonB-linked SusC/RagA family outer membrane protein
MRKILSLLIAFMLSVVAFAQNHQISGRITDEKGDPVPFATIKIKKTKIGASADEAGNFKLSVPENAILEISAAGVETREVSTAGAGDVINVTLTRITNELSTVIVTTSLGIKRQAKELGYAATSVTSKTLNQAKSVNVQQALNGKVSGVSVTSVNSGVFEQAKINIRGIRSLTGNNNPMLVVDGAPTPLGFLSAIPPDDIQDLTVLKSAASAQLYGPDAVNGVILVTTKKGAGKKLSVTFSSALQAARVAYFPKMQRAFGQGAGETIDDYGNYQYVPYENQQFGPKFDGTTKDIGVVLEDGSVQSGPYNDGHYKDKVKFWNTGLTWQNTISVSGEDFYASIQDAKIKGLMPNDENRRTSFRFNSGKSYGRLSVNYGLNYILQNYDVVNETGLANLFPAYNGSIFFLVMQTASNIPLLDYKDWQNNKFAQFSNYYNEYAVNPYWVIGNVRQKGREDDLIGNLDVNYKIADWLKASARLSTNLGFNNYKNTTAPVAVTKWADENRNPTQFSNRPGSVFDMQSYSSRINLDYFLSGDKDINKDFKVRYLAGGMLRQNRAKNVAVGGNNLVIPYLYNAAIRSGDAFVPKYTGSTTIVNNGNNYIADSRLLSAYGTFSVGYKGWANVEFSGRNDWDSRLRSENRSFFYPGVNAAVVLSEAIPAIERSGIISYAKVRGALSKSGNVNLGVYSLEATYSQTGGFPFGTVSGFTAEDIFPSTNLKPEFVKTTEVGLELGFLRNRINLEASYFDQKNTNQVLLVTQSSATGYPFQRANAADFTNRGVELDLNLTPLVKIGQGRIEFRMNATYNDNKVTRTLNDAPVVIGGNSGFTQNSASSPTANNIAVVGKPAFGFQLTDYERDPETGKVIVDSKTGNPTQAGEMVIKGRSLPLWVLGFTPSYTIGGFTASMTWDYKGGHSFYAGMGSDMDFAGISARSAEYGRQRFVFPNSVVKDASGKYVNNTNIQVQDGNYGFWTGASTNAQIGTNYFASAAAWRLREVNISYNLPLKWIGGGKIIQRLTVSAIGKNLLLFVPKSNQWGDPEFNYTADNNTSGISSSFQSPASRLFGGAITVQF